MALRNVCLQGMTAEEIQEMDLKVEGAKMKGMLNVLNKADVSSTPESSKSPDASINLP